VDVFLDGAPQLNDIAVGPGAITDIGISAWDLPDLVYYDNLNFCRTGPPTNNPCTAASAFSVDAEEWSIDAEAVEAAHVPAGGNPGGYLSGTNDAAGGLWSFAAPAAFQGDLSGAYGQHLNFDLRTSNADIFCVGDAAELPGSFGGLWAVGSEQGKIAADAILEGNSRYESASLPPVQLKVGGIDLKSFGSFDEDPETTSMTDGNVAKHTWKHLRIKNGCIVAGVFVNSPQGASAAINASKKAEPLSDQDLGEILHKDR